MSFYQTTIFYFAVFYGICGFFTRQIEGEDFLGRIIVSSILLLAYFLSKKITVVRDYLHIISLVLFSGALLHYANIWITIHEVNRALDAMYLFGFLVIAAGVFQSFIHLIEQVILGIVFLIIGYYLGTKIELMPVFYFMMNFLVLLFVSIIVSIKIRYTNNQITEKIRENFMLTSRLDSQKKTAKIIKIIAHEIANPLAIIRGVSDLMKNKYSNHDIKYFFKVDNAASRIAKLIQLMSCYIPSDCEHPKTDIVTATVSFLELHNAELNEKGIRIEKAFAEAPIWGHIQESSFVLILEQLLNNAIAETENYRANYIRLILERQEDTIMMRVQHAGIIQNEQMIFSADDYLQRFDQIKDFGLYTCKHELQKIGGEILLTSSDNNWVEFTIKIPLVHSK